MSPALILQEGAAIFAGVGRSFLHILPYLALSIPLAVMLKRTGVANKIRRGLGANPYMAVLMATLVGALSPFCSCGVIPIITALLLGGVPLAPVMSFWLASPSMDPEIFVLSVGSIGWELAIWRLAATFVMSLAGGLAVLWFDKKGWMGRDFLRPSVLGGRGKRASAFPEVAATGMLAPAVACCSGSSPVQEMLVLESHETCTCGCAADVVAASEPPTGSCGCGSGNTEKKSSSCNGGLRSGWKSLLEDTARTTFSLSMYMLVAFLLEALIIRYVPQDLIVSYLGDRSVWSVPFATLISIPMYTTNLTSLGMIGGLLQRGMSGGAALSFLIGGAVTTLPAMSAVYGIVRWRVFALYMSFCISGALLAGFAYQFADLLRH